ncbi:MAG: ATP synthase F0 subunit C [Acidobacteriaceae bacterium]|jgi:F-type H+-transporting ATPase subunit c|nr:ATP synthase F0 subunit C [Acidobacteriaceae bacterium]
MNAGLRKAIMAGTFALVLATAFGPTVFAQGAAAAVGDRQVWHLLGAGIGLGLVVIGAGLGIGKLAAAAAEGVARQPSAADKITGAVNLPLFLLEGVAILAEVFVLLIVLLNGRP